MYSVRNRSIQVLLYAFISRHCMTQSSCLTNPSLCPTLLVVYFDQHVGGALSKGGSKYALCMLCPFFKDASAL